MQSKNPNASEHPKIYYLIPDIKRPRINFARLARSIKKREFKKRFQSDILATHKPVGGVKVIYQHCMILRELGYDAIPVKMGKYEGNFYNYNIEALSFKKIRDQISPEDMVVASEFMPYEAELFDCRTKIIFVQNWINIRRRFTEADSGKNYSDLGYTHVLSCAEYTTNLIREYMGIEAMTITNGIDHKKFFQKKDARIENRVLCMPRKNPKDLEKIMSLVGRDRATFVMVDGLTEKELITEYQKSDIFLATGYPEGFGLPPLEAMRCGCAVVGFTGGGASEFMIDGETALVAKDGDCEGAAKKLALLLREKETKEQIRESGLIMSEKYSLENVQRELSCFYQDILP